MQLSFDSSSYLSDHVVFGVPVVSGATLMCAIVKEIRTKYGRTNAAIRLLDVFFLDRVVLDSDETIVVQLQIDEKNKTVELLRDNVKVLSAKFAVDFDGISNGRNNAQLFTEEKTLQRLNEKEFYRELHGYGYEHSGVFKSVSEAVWGVDGGGSVTFQKQRHVDTKLDGLLQAMVLSRLMRGTGQRDEKLTVPFSFKKVVFFGRDSDEQSSPRSCSGVFIDSASFKLVIDGSLSVKGEGAVFKEVSRPKQAVDIVIKSAACRLPGNVNSLSDLRRLLLAGTITDVKIPAHRIPARNTLAQGVYGKPLEGANILASDISLFDPGFFGINKMEAKATDPQQRLLLEVVYECFENAGVTCFEDCGFFVGQMGSEYVELKSENDKPTALGMIGGANSVLAGRLNFYFDSHGPSEAIDTACSSSLVALQNAVDAILKGRCKRAVVAGSSLILSLNQLAQRVSGNLLATDGGCKTFDASADGYGRSDGVAAVLIEAVSSPGDEVHCLAKISAVETNHGARSVALSAPNGHAHFLLIKKTLSRAKCASVDYWECHGTGTSLGDPIELSALQKSLKQLGGEGKTVVGSVKANMGHSEGCAGLVGLLKVICVMHAGYSMKLPRFKLLNKNIDIDGNVVGIPVVGEELDGPGSLVCGVSSFGVSGTNVAVVLTAPSSSKVEKGRQKLAKRLVSQGVWLLPVAAKTQRSLDLLTDKMQQKLTSSAAFPSSASSCDFVDQQMVAAAACARLKPMKMRSVFVKTASGENVHLNSAKFGRVGFSAAVKKEVSWNFVFRNGVFREYFVRNLASLAKTADKGSKMGFKMAEILSFLDFFVDIGVKFDFVSVDGSNSHSLELNKVIRARFGQHTAVLDAERDRIPENSLIVNSEAVQLRTTHHVNKAVGLIYLNGQGVDFVRLLDLSTRELGLLPFEELPHYQFDRQSFWKRPPNDDFDHFLIGNVVSRTELADSGVSGELICLGNYLVKRRLGLRRERASSLTSSGLMLEVLTAVGWLVSDRDGFEATNVDLVKDLDSGDMMDRSWIQTRVSTRKEPSGVVSVNVSCHLAGSLTAARSIQAKSSNLGVEGLTPVQERAILLFKCNFDLIVHGPGPVVEGVDPEQPQLFQSWIVGLPEVVASLDALNVDSLDGLKSLKVSTRGSIQSVTTPVLMERRVKLKLTCRNQQLEVTFLSDKDLNANKIPLFQVAESISVASEAVRVARVQSTACSKKSKDGVVAVLKQVLRDSIDADIAASDAELSSRGFVELGLDSLSMMGFLDELTSSHFPDADLNSTDLFTYTNVEALAQAIVERLADSSSVAPPRPPVHVQNTPIDARDAALAGVKPHVEGKRLNPSTEHAYWLRPVPSNVQTDIPQVVVRIHTDPFSATAEFGSTPIPLTGPSASLNSFASQLKSASAPELTLTFQFDSRSRQGDNRTPEKTTTTIDAAVVAFLLELSACLGKARKRLRVNVEDDSHPVDGFVAGFFKSWAVEKRNAVSYAFTEKINKVPSNLVTGMRPDEPDAQPSGTWLISGGTAGVGLEMARHLSGFDPVKAVLVLSRKGVLDSGLAVSSKVIPIKCNVSDYQQVLAALSSVSRLDGVIHSAGVLADAVVERQSASSFERVMAPKVDGLRHLLRAVEELHLTPQRVILNSSISSVLGNFGQTNYSASNQAAEKLVSVFRRRTGVGSIVHWGNWTQVGMASDVHVAKLLDASGFVGLSNEEGLRALDLVVQQNTERVLVGNMDWQKVFHLRSELRDMVDEDSDHSDSDSDDSSSSDNVGKPVPEGATSGPRMEKNSVDSSRPPTEAAAAVQLSPVQPSLELVREHINAEIRDMIGCPEDEELDDKSGFMEIGLDSFKLYSLAHNLSTRFSKASIPVVLSVIDLFENPSTASLSSYVFKKLERKLSAFSSSQKDHANLGLKSAVLQSPKSGSDSLQINGTTAKNGTPIPSMEPSQMEALVIGDHVIQSKVLVPAAFMVDKFLLFSGAVVLKNIQINDALHLEDLAALEISRKELKLVVQSGCSPVPVVVCHPETDSKNVLPRMLVFPHTKMASLAAPSFYKAMDKRGVQYGRHLQLLENIRRSANRMTCTVYLDVHSPQWVLIEAGLQAMAAVLFDRHKMKYFLPIRMSKLVVSEAYRRVTAGGFKIRAEITTENDRFLEGNVSISTDPGPGTGAAVVVVKMCNVIAVRRQVPRGEARKRVENGVRRNAFSSVDDLDDSSDSDGVVDSGGVRGGRAKDAVEVVTRRRVSNKHESLTLVLKDSASNQRGVGETLSTEKLHETVHDFNRDHFLDVVEMRSEEEEEEVTEEETVQLKMDFVSHLESIKRVRSRTSTLTKLDLTGVSATGHQGSRDERKVVIIGHGCQYAGPCRDSDSFYSFLLDSASTPTAAQPQTHPQPLLLDSDPAWFHPQSFNITPREALFMDPQQRLLLQAVNDVLTSNTSLHLNPAKTGVFIGASSSDFGGACLAEFAHICSQHGDAKKYLTAGTNSSCMAGRIAHFLRLSGPCLTLDTGCSSFGAALCTAADQLAAGAIDFAVVGSVNYILNEENTQVLSEAGMLSAHSACQVFDARADGYCRSEGVTAVVLGILQEETGDCVQLAGWAMGHNGTSAALTVPNGQAQVRVMERAMQAAGLDRVDLVECHGSGTPLGDPIEVNSVLKCLQKEAQIVVTGTKAHVGHSEANAAGVSLVAGINILRHQVVPGQRHFRCLNPKIRLLKDSSKLVVPVVNQELEGRQGVETIAINSFGFSGTNVSLVLRKPSWSFEDDDEAALVAASKVVFVAAEQEQELVQKVARMERVLAENEHQAIELESLSVSGNTASSGASRAAILIDLIGPQLLTALRPGAEGRESELGLILSRFQHPVLILKELSAGCSGFRKIISKTASVLVSTEAVPALSKGETTDVILNTSLILFLTHKLNVKKRSKMYFSDGFTEAMLEAVRIVSKRLHLDVALEPELPSKIDFKLVTLASIFEDFVTNDLSMRPCESLIKFCGQLFVDGYLEGTPKVKKIDLLKCEKSTKVKYWPLERPSRPLWWHRKQGTDPCQSPLEQGGENPVNRVDDVVFQITEQLLDSPQKTCNELSPDHFKAFTVMPSNEASEMAALKVTKQLNCGFTLSPQNDVKKVLLILDNAASDTDPETAHNLVKLVSQLVQSGVDTLICLVFEGVLSPYLSLIRSVMAEHPQQPFIGGLFVDSVQNMDSLKPALHLMAQGGHKGAERVVISKNNRLYLQKLDRWKREGPLLSVQKYSKILITGGSGGLGQLLLQTFKSNQQIVLSRTAPLNPLVPSSRHYLGDVADFSVLQEILQKEPDIDAIIHCAGTVSNSTVSSITLDHFHRVSVAKIDGTKNLLKMATHLPKLRLFVGISSVAASFGSFGQSNYAWSNSVMEQLVQTAPGRFQKLVLAFGPVKDVGMLSGDRLQPIRKQIEDSGWHLLGQETITAAVQKLQNESGKLIVFDGNFERISGTRNDLRSLLSRVQSKKKTNHQKTVEFEPLATAEAAERSLKKVEKRSVESISAELKTFVHEISGLDSVSPAAGFMSIGLDSLMIEELRSRIQDVFDVVLTPADMYTHSSVRALAHCVADKIPDKFELLKEAEPITQNISDESIKKASKESEMDENDVAIVAVSASLPKCSNLNQFTEALFSQTELLESFTKQPGLQKAGFLDPNEVDSFDYSLFNLSIQDARTLDPQIRLLLRHAYLVLEQAGYLPHLTPSPHSLSSRIGCICSSEPSHRVQPTTPESDFLTSMYLSNQQGFGAAWISHLLNLQGVSLNVYTACSSALVAIHEAVAHLRSGALDACLVGSSHLLEPCTLQNVGLKGLALSKENTCRPFDTDASGIIPGSFAGCLLLKKLSRAVQDDDAVLAVIKGVGVSNDGANKSNFMAPGQEGQVLAMKRALEDAGGVAADVRYLECHATGTAVGDEVEVGSIIKVFSEGRPRARGNELRIGSVKANVGHCFAGAGMVGILKVLGIFDRCQVPGQINLVNPLEVIRRTPWIKVETKTTDVDVDVDVEGVAGSKKLVMVNAFGIGGTDAAIVLQKYTAVNRRDEDKDASKQPRFTLLPVTGHSENACLENARNTGRHLKHTQTALINVAQTLQSHRKHYQYRCAVVSASNDHRHASLALSELALPQVISSKRLTAEHVCFFFAPQGVQYANMLTLIDLADDPKMARKLSKLTAVASDEFRLDFCEVLNSPVQVERPEYAQVALFITLVVIAEALARHGIVPTTALGHSVGEYAALCVSGSIRAEEAVRLLARRSLLMASTAPARMISFKDPEKRIKAFPEGVEVSAHLSEKIKVVVGVPEKIAAFQQQLKSQKIDSRELRTSRGFHSSMMDPVLPQFRQMVEEFTFNPPRFDVISNLHGKVISTDELRHPEKYFTEHMRNPVRMDQSIDTLLANKDVCVVVEIGPPGMLQNLLLQKGRPDVKIVKTLQTKDQVKNVPRNSPMILDVVAEMWKLGVDVDFGAGEQRGQRVSGLPGYAFDKTTCRQETASIKLGMDEKLSLTLATTSSTSSSTVTSTVSLSEKETRGGGDEEVMSKLRHIWGEVLATSEAIDLDSDFFELGGNSLNGVQLIWRIEEELRLQASVSDLFEHSKFFQFYTHLMESNDLDDAAFEKAEFIDPLVPIGLDKIELERYPLSLPQEQMFLLFHLQPGVHYNIVFSISFTSGQHRFSEDIINKSLNELVRRQACLRSVFSLDSEVTPQGFQRVNSVNQVLKRGQLDLNWTEMSSQNDFARAVEAERAHVFDISESCFRIRTFRVQTEPPTHRMIVSQHHIVTDGWSMTVFADELSSLYNAFYYCRQPPPEVAVQYIDFALKNRATLDPLRVLQYAQHLSQFEPSSLYSDSRGSTQTTKVFEARSTVKMIPDDVVRGLHELSKECSVSFYTMLLVAFSRTLSLWTEHEDSESLMLGIASAGRTVPESRRLIGYFLNNLIYLVPHKAELFASNLHDVVGLVKTCFAESTRHQDVPYHLLLAEWRRLKHRDSGSDMFKVYFNYRHNLDFPSVQIDGVEATVSQETNNRIFDFSVTIDEVSEGKTRLLIDWRTDLFDEEVVSNFAAELIDEMKTISRAKGGVLEDDKKLNFLDDVLPESVTQGLRPTVIDDVISQCRLTPENVAVVSPEGQKTSYRQLRESVESKARALDRFISTLADSRTDKKVVPICLDFNEQVEWMLAVQLSGLAYCPLDPETPDAVNSQMVSQLDSNVVISRKQLGPGLICLSPESILAMSPAPPVVDGCENRGSNSISKTFSSNDLMYVLFTSGSTGFPKGVQIEHAQVASFLEVARKDFCVTAASVIGHSVNTIFDVSVFNMYSVLTSGGCLVQYPSIRSVVETCIQEDNLTHLFLTSAVFNSLDPDTVEKLAKLGNLEHLIVGGETPESRNITVFKSSRTRISQIYGPTEATVWVTVDSYNFENGGREIDPRVIGREIANTDVLLVSQGKQLSEHSRAVGELCLTGNISRGYLDSTDPEERDKFKILESKDGSLKRVFVTGDYGRRLDSGKIQFLGRKKGFLKHQGARIDPVFVERSIKALSGVANCVVLQEVFEREKYLTAYIAWESNSQNGRVDEQEMRKMLAEKMGANMIPNFFVFVDHIPVNLSGKIDKKRLALLFFEKMTTSSDKNKKNDDVVEADNPDSSRLSLIWIRLLNLPESTNVQNSDNLFALGGSSIILFTLKSEIFKAFKVELSIDVLYRVPVFIDQLNLILKAASSPNNSLTRHVPSPETSSTLSREMELTKLEIIELQTASSYTAQNPINIYTVHAIGGTIYPFFGLAQVVDPCFNLYGIPFNMEYPVSSINQLAHLYAYHIYLHAQSMGCSRIVLMGHSLGGMLIHQIITHLDSTRSLKAGKNTLLDIVMFDAWTIGTDKLNLEFVEKYLTDQFSIIPDADLLLAGSLKLSKLLVDHEFTVHNRIHVHLFKAQKMTESALRHAILPTMTDDVIQSVTDNGWGPFTHSVTTHLVPGDHDSCLKLDNLKEIKEQLNRVLESSILLLN